MQRLERHVSGPEYWTESLRGYQRRILHECLRGQGNTASVSYAETENPQSLHGFGIEELVKVILSQFPDLTITRVTGDLRLLPV